MTTFPFRTVLVANRGEIAVRVIRTLRALGLRSVAIHSDADRDARHVLEADVAVRIGPPPTRRPPTSRSRRSSRRPSARARRPSTPATASSPSAPTSRAPARRPASSSWARPRRCSTAIGDKLGVKARVAAAGVPVIAGPLGALAEGDAALRAAARATGFPMLLKAIGGGGGRGLRRVDDVAGLAAAASESARREAGGAFGDARLYAEALVAPARHVEVQLLADAYGAVRILGDRDCSLQRRHQKVIEEAPAPTSPPATRRTLHEAARNAARALGYRNAGTVRVPRRPRRAVRTSSR